MTTALVGFVHPASSIAPQFRRSLTHVLMRDAARSGVPGLEPMFLGELDRESSANISFARCQIVREFLEHPRQPDWLWMVDTDMTFPDTIFDRLLAVADPEERPIVGGLCFGVRPKKIAGTERFNETLGTSLDVFPTMFLLDEGGVTRHCVSYPPDTLMQVASTGAACLLMHRNVLADPRWLEDGHPMPWFRESVLHGKPVSEDQFFCLKAGSLGFPIFVDTGARTGHVKTVVIDEDVFAEQFVAPPATERVTVIVPVLNRPQNAEPFMRSVQASTGLVDVVAVCSEEKDALAWRLAGARVLEIDEVSFAEKVNQGTAATTLAPVEIMQFGSSTTIVKSNPWIFITGDDVRFHPGWLDHAQYVANITGAHVVGTNDLGNPRVMAGEHGTHLLIRRSYIEEHGASWDGPGVVCHEGYSHWFVDDEIVEAAKQRGVWASAKGSVVEHLHPIWGKGDDDETYRLGQKFSGRDKTHYIGRKRKYVAQP